MNAGRALGALLVLALGACTSVEPRTRTAMVRADAPPAAESPAVNASPTAAIIIRRATDMLGQPYQWGGAAPGGFDCSGLVIYAASGAGLHLPRTAHEQRRAGVPVPRGDVRAGDLVFLHLARKELHVGIALDADRFVHAPSTGGRVRIDSLAAAPYARGFLEARRIIVD